ncbi:MAG TPA: WD40 repeat domain-containing protein, partial [Thermoanaerobaculia bacterium]
IESELPEVSSSGVVILEDCERLAVIDPERLRNWWRELALGPSSRDYCLVTVGRPGNPLSSLRDAGPQPVSITLSGLRLDDAQQSLASPAALNGVNWESGLPRRIVCDLADAGRSGPSGEVTNPTVDPSLLALVMAELVDGKTSQITHEKYDQGDWIGDRLAGMASRGLQAIEEPGRTLASRLLARLVTRRGEPRRLPVAEAIKILGVSSAETLLDEMSDRRLVRVGTHVELRHSMLGRWWTALGQWAAIERDFIPPSEALKNSIALWVATGRDATALPQGRALAYMDKAAKDDEEARSFVRMAQRAIEIRRVAYAALAIIVLGIGFFGKDWMTERERGLVARNKADHLATLSRSASDPTQALVLAIAAGEAAETPRSRDALLNAVPKSRLRAVLKHDSEIVSAALSEDGNSILSLTSGGSAAKWDVSSGAKLFSREFPRPVLDAEISRDLTSVAVKTLKDELLWFPLDSTPGFGTKALSFSLSPTSNELAIGIEGAVNIIRRPGYQLIPLKADGILTDVSFTHNGEAIVANSDKGTLNIWTRLHDPLLKPVRDFARTTGIAAWT